MSMAQVGQQIENPRTGQRMRFLETAAETEIFAALLGASAAELTSRQRAMAAATENAEELIKKYSRIMNRARQDTITTEIMEIVSGAEALRAGSGDDEGGLMIRAGV